MEASLFYTKAIAVSVFISLFSVFSFYCIIRICEAGLTCNHHLILFHFSSSSFSLFSSLPAPCSTVTCQLYAECVSSNGTSGVCVCPNDCPSKSSPVCGSDINTYDSECHLRVASCNRKTNVSVRHVGECSKLWL